MTTRGDSCLTCEQHSDNYTGSDGSKNMRDWSMDDFNVSETVSTSSSSTVFLARERASGTPCVLKRISKAQAVRNHLCKQIERELSIHSRLDHSNVVTMYAWFHEVRSIYIVMEPADMTVAHLIQSRLPGSVDDSTVTRLISHLLSGLAYLHALNIIHRDIKPSNLFLVSAGSKFILKIGDFGCSVHTTDIRRSVRGTTPYLAPEIVSGSGHSFAVDIWSSGITAHELLTGNLFFDGDSPMEIYRKILKEDYTPPETLNDHLTSFLISCLEKDPTNRRTAIELIKIISCE